MNDDGTILFEVATPLGFVIRTSPRYWDKVVDKHPDLTNCVEVVKQTLMSPDEIRRSSRDERLLLFYLTVRTERWVVAVARQLNGDGFLVTAYQTDAIKEGEEIWHK